MSTTSRLSKLDIRLRNPTSTQRQWLQDTDLLAVRILCALRTPRRDFEGGGGSGEGAMAGRTPIAPIWNPRPWRDGNGDIRIHWGLRDRRSCVGNIWSCLPSVGTTQRTETAEDRSSIHQEGTPREPNDSPCDIEIYRAKPYWPAYKSGARHRGPAYVSASTYQKPHCAASACLHTIREPFFTLRTIKDQNNLLTHPARPLALLPLLARGPCVLRHQHKRRGRQRQGKMRARA